jgi:hypothetical protein
MLAAWVMAFCGFFAGETGARGGLYNDATQVVLMRHGTTTVLSMQNTYRGPPAAFALVVPVPAVVTEQQVHVLPRGVFERIDTHGAPRLVEYWEQDPCWQEMAEPVTASVDPGSSHRGGGGGGSYVPPTPTQVVVEASFVVGEYEIVVLSASESTALERWLRAHDYAIPAKAEKLLRPYVESGMKFFVARVDPAKVTFEGGVAQLSPLRVVYDSPELTLPVRLGLASSPGTQDLIVNVLAPGVRYEVANRPNVTIPTNLAVHEAARGGFAEMYAALFDHTVERVPGAVVTEYAWDQQRQCDPCTGPALDSGVLSELGYDVIGAQYGYVLSFTMTRLHLRYGTDLDDDLVFRAVAPIAGGNGEPAVGGELALGATPAYTNVFQARYAILHRWEGPMTCSSPQRGRWGGPVAEDQPRAAPAVQPATETAFAQRSRWKLRLMLGGALPAVATMTSEAAAPSSAAFTPFPPPLPPPPCCSDDRWYDKQPPEIGVLPAPEVKRRAHGCGCGASDGVGGGALVALALTLRVRRRRRRT